VIIHGKGPRARRPLVRLALLLVALTAGLVTPAAGASAATAFSSFDGGVLAPNQIVGKIWHNANSDTYLANLVGTRVDDGSNCTVSVVRTWFERRVGGERVFHVEYQGDTDYTCRVRVWLGRVDAFRTSALGAIEPGQSVGRVWNNAHLERNVYQIGLVPSVPTTDAPCQFSVRTSSSGRPDGSTQVTYYVTNIGTTACSVEARMASLPVTTTSAFEFPIRPGEGTGIYTAPIFFPGGVTGNLVLPGAYPVPASNGTCTLTAGVSSSSSLGGLAFRFVNVGAVTCSGAATFAVL
jgi:hypothetical protein